MWKKGLVYKTIVVYTLISSLCIFVFCMALSTWFESYYFMQRKNQLSKQGELIGQRAIKQFNSDEEVTLERLRQDMSLLGSYVDADVFIFNYLGYVHLVSNDKFDYLLNNYKNFLSMDFDELRQGHSIERRSGYKELLNQDMYVYMIPIMENDFFRGAVAMFTPLNYIYEPLKRVNRFIFVLGVALIFVSAFIVYKCTKKMIINPLAQINNAAKKISKGEVERRVYLKAKDEISELANSFNTMADSLEKVEKNRREFISNVSHELRTPITSIKGFIGGILDGVIPKDKENYYLSVTYEEIQRLTRLVNDLLDLSAMEAGKFKLNVTEIDINEIIRLCVIRFETRINSKQLKVDVTLQDEHLYVAGDRDRLIQVVTNLLDNAIKYVNDGGNIKIVTRTKGDKVLVSLFDDGPPIPEMDLKHIWERFYKSDKSRTSKVSTGLGLPIVRNILTQLGEDIWVENGEKEGVTFYFTLKKA